jgi:type II secretory pathway pseudopilin PulG
VLRTRRAGYTILELVVVLALLIILGAVIIPSFAGFYGNSKQRAAADTVRQRLAEARAKAIERGMPFRVAVHADMTRIRVAPDGDQFASYTADDPAAFDSLATEDRLDEATVQLLLEPDDDRPPDAGGWITVATLRADATSKETRPAVVSVLQKDYAPIQIQVRGLTGHARTATAAKAGGK